MEIEIIIELVEGDKSYLLTVSIRDKPYLLTVSTTFACLKRSHTRVPIMIGSAHLIQRSKLKGKGILRHVYCEKPNGTLKLQIYSKCWKKIKQHILMKRDLQSMATTKRSISSYKTQTSTFQLKKKSNLRSINQS